MDKLLKVGPKSYDGSSEVTITAADLGLETALKYHGVTTTPLTDGATTKPITIGGTNHYQSAGCVVIYSTTASGSTEFVWNGNKWEKLGDGINYKVKQEAVPDPAVSGSILAFIDTISQDTNGVISPTKKSVPTGTTAVTGVVKLVSGDLRDVTYNNGVAAAGGHSHSQYSLTGHTHPEYSKSDTATTETGHYTPSKSASTYSGGWITGIKLDSKKHVTEVTTASTAHTHSQYSPTGHTHSEYATTTALNDLIGDIEDNELVVSTIVTKINDSCGFNENSESVLPNGQNLTEAITELQNHSHNKVNSATTSYSATTVYSTTANSKVYLVGVTGTGSSYQQLYKNTGVTMSASCIYATSDERLKDFKGDIECDLEKLKNIPKKYFSWKDDESKSIQIGTSAQEVHKLYPEIVSIDDDGTHSVAYDRLSIVALSAIDKLYDMVKELQTKMMNLKIV